MKKMNLSFILILSLMLGFGACSSSKKKGEGPDFTEGESQQYQDDAARDTTLELNGDSDSGRAGGLRTIYFAYDSAALSNSARNVLKENSEYLKSNGGVKIQIEGHCDERGGIQYNLALGERRAKAVKNYLNALGVSSSRVDTVSYGKERPIEFGHTESSWSRNRRANFVITAN